jgi:hypothetical protein
MEWPTRQLEAARKVEAAETREETDKTFKAVAARKERK